MNKAKQTKQKISTALIEMLQRQPMDLITIKELTQKAQVGRTAFYNNFKNLDDVLKYVYREAHYQVFQDKFKDEHYQSSDQYLWDMLTFFEDNSDLLTALNKWHLIDAIAKYNTEICLEYTKQYSDDIIKNNAMYYTLYTGVVAFNMASLWIFTGKKESKEDYFQLLKYFQSKQGETG